MFDDQATLSEATYHTGIISEEDQTQAYDCDYTGIQSIPYDPNRIYDWYNIPSIPTRDVHQVDPTYLVAPMASVPNPQPSHFGMHSLVTDYGMLGQYLGFTTDQLSGWPNGGFAARRIEKQTTGLATQDRWEYEAYGALGKRDRSPEPDLGVAELGGLNSEGTRVAKKIALIGEIGVDMTADMTAPRCQTQKLSTGMRQTPKCKNQKSKLSRCKVDVPAVTPPQGVSSQYTLGPTVTQSASGTPDFLGPAWNEGDGGFSGEMESPNDAHDEEETDKERQRRLMIKVDGVWCCAGCKNKRFFDRCTLQRHCKSSAHSKARDRKKCPYCPKQYLRHSLVDRHLRKHHSQNTAGEGAQDSST